MVEPLSLNFRVFTVKLVGVQKFRNFTVFCSISDGAAARAGVQKGDKIIKVSFLIG